MYLAEVTVSGRMTATLPLPALASGLRDDMAEKVRLSELTDMDGTAPLELLLVPPVLVLEDVELLQAAAARHKASDTDATAAPCLATGII